MSKRCDKHGYENCVRCAMEAAPKPTIHVKMVLDKSGSMASTWDQTLAGLNEYVDGLRNDPNSNYLFSLTVLGPGPRTPKMEHLLEEVQLDQVPKYGRDEITPDGTSTPLYEAALATLQKTDIKEDPVLFVIFTDGEDNASTEKHEKDWKALVAEREKLGNYTFVYLGVDKAAWGQAQKVGVRTANAAAYANTAADRLRAFDELRGATFKMSGAISRSYAVSSVTGGPRINSVAEFYSQQDEEDAPLDVSKVGQDTTEEK